MSEKVLSEEYLRDYEWRLECDGRTTHLLSSDVQRLVDSHRALAKERDALKRQVEELRKGGSHAE